MRHALFKHGDLDLLAQITRIDAKTLISTQKRRKHEIFRKRCTDMRNKIKHMKQKMDNFIIANEALSNSNILLLRMLGNHLKDSELRTRKIIYIIMMRMKYKPPTFMSSVQSFFINEGILTPHEIFPKIEFDKSTLSFFLNLSQKLADPQHDFIDQWMEVFTQNLCLALKDKQQLGSSETLLIESSEGDMYNGQIGKATIAIEGLMKLYVNVVCKETLAVKWEDICDNDFIRILQKHNFLTDNEESDFPDDLSIIFRQLKGLYENDSL